MDPDWPGVSPYIWDSSPTAANYTLQTGQLYPTAPANTFPAQVGPPPPAPVTPPPAVSDFNAITYRSTLATQWPALGRLDLNRTPAPYPANGVQPPDRQQFALDIYNRLVAVTGMTAVAASPSANTVTLPQYNALRRLRSCRRTSSITSTAMTS